MIEVHITKAQKKRAISMSKHAVYNRSMRGKEANLVGAYGEIIVFDHFLKIGLNAYFAHKTTHDIEVEGYKIDVKTKERTVIPKPHYECTVPAYNHAHQKPNWFVFVSLLKNGEGLKRFDRAWILGYISYYELNKKSKLWRKGEIDETNNWKATIDCWNVSVNDLTNLKETI